MDDKILRQASGEPGFEHWGPPYRLPDAPGYVEEIQTFTTETPVHAGPMNDALRTVANNAHAAWKGLDGKADLGADGKLRPEQVPEIVQGSLDAHIADGVKHLTAGERSAWNSKAEGGHTHTAAQVGADPAGSAAGVQNSLNGHAGNGTIHIAASERNTWNSKAEGNHTHTAAQAGADPAGSANIVQNNLNGHAGNTTIHLTASERNTWNSKAAGNHTHTASQVGAASANHTHSDYAPTQSPRFSSSVSMGRTGTIGDWSVALGSSVEASGMDSHAEGSHSIASGVGCHAEGSQTIAEGNFCHAEGSNTLAKGAQSHAGGWFTIADNYQYAIGTYNVEKSNESLNNGNRFIVGGGWLSYARSNAFRVHMSGAVYGGNYSASGADYAEYFEWLDGNREKEDRAGRFVTLDGGKIRIANPDDDYILGMVSANPSVVGDVYDDQWSGMYLRDVFGRTVYEDVETPAQTGPDGTVIREACTGPAPKVNPDYRSDEPYIPRSDRPEWSAVGLLGKLVAVDDGTCEVNGYCKPGPGGIAVKAEGRTPYRVLARLDETHVQLFLK